MSTATRPTARAEDATAAQGTLALAARQPDRAGEAQREAKRLIERAIPVAQGLASRAGRAGVTAGNLRLALASRGIITGHESGRVGLTWVGRVYPAAGLRATALFRRSVVKKTHGVPNRVWVLPEFYDEALHGEPENLPDHVLQFIHRPDGGTA